MRPRSVVSPWSARMTLPRATETLRTSVPSSRRALRQSGAASASARRQRTRVSGSACSPGPRSFSAPPARIVPRVERVGGRVVDLLEPDEHAVRRVGVGGRAGPRPDHLLEEQVVAGREHRPLRRSWPRDRVQVRLGRARPAGSTPRRPTCARAAVVDREASAASCARLEDDDLAQLRVAVEQLDGDVERLVDAGAAARSGHRRGAARDRAVRR